MRRALLIVIPFLLFALVAVPTGSTQEKKADELKRLQEEAAKIQAEIDARQAKAGGKKGVERGRGHIPPDAKKLTARHAAAAQRHGNRVKSLPNVTLAKFDCRDMGWAPAMKDQGACGSCYQFSGAMTCTGAFYKAGYKDQIGTGFAEQYGMDCHNWGGCDGGDEYDIIDWCHKNGLPTEADYGPYLARSGQCRLKAGTKLWKIADFGFCTPSQEQGLASYQDMKNCIAAYGPISVAGSADGGFQSYTTGLFRGNSNSVNHAILAIGWDDSASPKGALRLQNQWSREWGDGGYMLCEYGANQWGTEAIWCSVAALPPPPGSDITVTILNLEGQTDVPVTIKPTASGGTGPYSWSYDYGDGVKGSAPFHSYQQAGSFTLTAVATDAKGAMGSGSATVTIGTLPPPPPPPVGDYAQFVLDKQTPPGTYTLMPKAVLDRLRVLDAERQLLLNPVKGKQP